MWSHSVSFVSDVPGKNSGAEVLGGGGLTTTELVRLVKSGRKSLTIESPYLVTTRESQALSREAIARGVRVRIATFNLDPRSSNLNTECLTIIRDARIAERVRQAMDVDMQPESAWHTTREFNPDGVVGIGRQIKVWLRRLEPKAVL